MVCGMRRESHQSIRQSEVALHAQSIRQSKAALHAQSVRQSSAACHAHGLKMGTGPSGYCQVGHGGHI